MLSWARRLSAQTPLRVKLVAAVLLLVAAGLALTGVAATTALRGYLVDRVDRQLVDASQGPVVERLIRDQDGPGGHGFQLPFYYYAEGRGADGALQLSVIAQPLDGSPVRSQPRLGADVTDHAGQLRTVAAVSGAGRWRVLTVERDDSAYPFQTVAASLAEVDSTVRRLWLIDAFVSVAVLLLVGLVGSMVVRRSLRPLVSVEQTAEAIAGGELHRRVPDFDARTEVGSLTRSLNGMLNQIEAAFRDRERSEAAARTSEDRMRRFVTDASHELRTPLTSIRGYAELYRQGAVPEPEAVTRLLRRIEDEAARMGVLVEDLLLLARLDQQRPLQQQPVDLLVLCTDAVQDARAIAPARPVALDVQPSPAPPVVLGDETRLRQVLSNLLSNALTHTPPESPVTVRLGVVGEHAVLEVADEGPGMAEEDAARVFERFYRVDPSRNRASGGGSGLGLSIVASLVDAQGGTVAVDTAPGAGATFRVTLPLAPLTGWEAQG